jgi:HTH-type transcriptional regulator/antitoxin HigA
MTRIENEAQYNWAVSRVEKLLPLVDDNTPVTDNNYIELKLLSELVADYSDEHYQIGSPDLVSTLKLRMYEMGLNQTSLAGLLGISKSRISDYLNGRSEPTLTVAREMSIKLNINADIVLGV